MDHTDYEITLIRSRRKSLAIEITPELQVVVRAPARMPVREINAGASGTCHAGNEAYSAEGSLLCTDHWRHLRAHHYTESEDKMGKLQRKRQLEL